MRLTAHANLVRGTAESIPTVLNLLREDGITVEGNPDIYTRAYTSFTIDDARELRDRASLRAVGGGGRMFVIAAPAIASEAQNALLKTFEEPPAGARFVVIVPAPEMLLPTLRSRMQMLSIDSGVSTSPIDTAKFLAAGGQARLDMLKPLLEKDDDDRRDVSGMLSFLASLETALGRKPRDNAVGLKAIYRARKYIGDRGASVKTLLEQMSLLIPGK